MGIDPLAAAARDDRVDHRTPPAGVFVSDEEPVLLAHGGRADRVLDEVVVDLDLPLLDEEAQHRPLREGVVDRLAHETFGQVTTTFLEAQEGPMDSFEDESTEALPLRFP